MRNSRTLSSCSICFFITLLLISPFFCYGISNSTAYDFQIVREIYNRQISWDTETHQTGINSHGSWSYYILEKADRDLYGRGDSSYWINAPYISSGYYEFSNGWGGDYGRCTFKAYREYISTFWHNDGTYENPRADSDMIAVYEVEQTGIYNIAGQLRWSHGDNSGYKDPRSYAIIGTIREGSTDFNLLWQSNMLRGSGGDYTVWIDPASPEIVDGFAGNNALQHIYLDAGDEIVFILQAGAMAYRETRLYNQEVSIERVSEGYSRREAWDAANHFNDSNSHGGIDDPNSSLWSYHTITDVNRDTYGLGNPTYWTDVTYSSTDDCYNYWTALPDMIRVDAHQDMLSALWNKNGIDPPMTYRESSLLTVFNVPGAGIYNITGQLKWSNEYTTDPRAYVIIGTIAYGTTTFTELYTSESLRGPGGDYTQMISPESPHVVEGFATDGDLYGVELWPGDQIVIILQTGVTNWRKTNLHDSEMFIEMIKPITVREADWDSANHSVGSNEHGGIVDADGDFWSYYWQGDPNTTGLALNQWETDITWDSVNSRYMHFEPDGEAYWDGGWNMINSQSLQAYWHNDAPSYMKPSWTIAMYSVNQPGLYNIDGELEMSLFTDNDGTFPIVVGKYDSVNNSITEIYSDNVYISQTGHSDRRSVADLTAEDDLQQVELLPGDGIFFAVRSSGSVYRNPILYDDGIQIQIDRSSQNRFDDWNVTTHTSGENAHGGWDDPSFERWSYHLLTADDRATNGRGDPSVWTDVNRDATSDVYTFSSSLPDYGKFEAYDYTLEAEWNYQTGSDKPYKDADLMAVYTVGQDGVYDIRGKLKWSCEHATGPRAYAIVGTIKKDSQVFSQRFSEYLYSTALISPTTPADVPNFDNCQSLRSMRLKRGDMIVLVLNIGTANYRKVNLHDQELQIVRWADQGESYFNRNNDWATSQHSSSSHGTELDPTDNGWQYWVMTNGFDNTAYQADDLASLTAGVDDYSLQGTDFDVSVDATKFYAYWNSNATLGKQPWIVAIFRNPYPRTAKFDITGATTWEKTITGDSSNQGIRLEIAKFDSNFETTPSTSTKTVLWYDEPTNGAVGIYDVADPNLLSISLEYGEYIAIGLRGCRYNYRGAAWHNANLTITPDLKTIADDFFDLVDLTTSEMAVVSSQYNQGQYEAALDTFRDIFFDKLLPIVTDQMGSASSTTAQLMDNTVKLYDLNGGYETQNIGAPGEINWFLNPTYEHWTYFLSNMFWANPLITSFAESPNANTAYLEKWTDYWVDFSLNNYDQWYAIYGTAAAEDYGGLFINIWLHRLVMGDRTRALMRQLSAASKANVEVCKQVISGEDLAIILTMMAGRNLPKLDDVIHGGVPNQVISSAFGMLEAGVIMDNCTDASDWFDTGEYESNDYLTTYYMPDGSDMEQSFNYNTAFMDVGVSIVDLLESAYITDSDLADDYAGPILNRFRFLLSMVRPNGMLPGLDLNSDGDWSSVMDYQDYFNDTLASRIDDYTWGSASGSEPNFTSIAFPYGGFYIMRDGWDENSNHLFMKSSRMGKGHFDESGNQIQVTAYGKTMLIDSGGSLYVSDSRNDYFHESFGHNTIIVDGYSQRMGGEKTPAWTTTAGDRWHNSDDFDFCEGIFGDDASSYYGTSDGSTSITDVTHYREVTFLRKHGLYIVSDLLDATNSHDYTQIWCFDSDYANSDISTAGTDSIVTDSATLPNVSLYNFSDKSLTYTKYEGYNSGGDVFGWQHVGSGYSSAVDTHVDFSGSGDELIVTLIRPMSGTDDGISSISDASGSGYAGFYCTMDDNSTIKYRIRETTGSITIGDVTATADSLLIVTDSNANVTGVALGCTAMIINGNTQTLNYNDFEFTRSNNSLANEVEITSPTTFDWVENGSEIYPVYTN